MPTENQATMPTLERLAMLEAELSEVNESNAQMLDNGERPTQYRMKLALLLGTKVEFYRLALADTAAEEPEWETMFSEAGHPVASCEFEQGLEHAFYMFLKSVGQDAEDRRAETAELRKAADHVNRYLIGYTKGMGEEAPPLMVKLQQALAAALAKTEAK